MLLIQIKHDWKMKKYEAGNNSYELQSKQKQKKNKKSTSRLIN